MLSAQAYSFRMKSRLAISLSWIAGYVNAVTFIVCGTMTSHVTGNTTIALLRNVEGQRQLAGYAAFAVGAFFAGTLISAVLVEGARRAEWRSKYVVPIAVEAGFLVLLALELRRTGAAPSVHGGDWWAMVAFAAAAMGVQNATITRVSGSVIRTTHLTGVVTDIGIESVQLAHRWSARVRASSPLRGSRLLRIARREPSVLRLLLLASILGSFVFGAIVGTACFRWNPTLSMLPPIVFLLWIVWIDVRSPIADVKELDALADVTAGGAGTLRELLPPSVGVYRLHAASRGAYRPPDFQQWAERVPEGRRVLVLCLSSSVRIDEDSAQGLVHGVELLRKKGRHLILGGITQAHYAAFERFGVFRSISREDAWSDVEFALARAVSLASDETAAG